MQRGGRKDGRFVLPLLGLSSICRLSLSNHLLDSISSSVTSADYVSSKQPATWRHASAIMVREWQLVYAESRRKYKRKDEKSWCKEGEEDWKEAEEEVMSSNSGRMYACTDCNEACMQVMQIQELWWATLNKVFLLLFYFFSLEPNQFELQLALKLLPGHQTQQPDLPLIKHLVKAGNPL